MCWQLRIGVAMEHEAAALARLSVRGLHVGRVSAAEAGFPPGIAVFDLTSGQCACELYRGGVSGESDADARARRRSKYQARGWSEAKIARALRSAKLPSDAASGRTRVWELVSDLAVAHGSAFVLAHMLSDEAVRAHPRTMCSLESFRASSGTFAAETLVEVRR